VEPVRGGNRNPWPNQERLDADAACTDTEEWCGKKQSGSEEIGEKRRIEKPGRGSILRKSSGDTVGV